MKKPVIGIVSCQKKLDGYLIQSVNEFYIEAIRDFSAIPLLLTAGNSESELEQILSHIDGILLPGSHSNVAPEHYGAEHLELQTDHGRDQLSLDIIRLAVEKQIPILGICRGFQEMNVAMGGSLHPQVHELELFLDHREQQHPDFEVKYAATHNVSLSNDGFFKKWMNGEKEIVVNSLHGQGVNKLGGELQIEAVADDGLIEAFSLPSHNFFIGVQWHPEWQATEQSFSTSLFEKFIAKSSQNI